MVKELVAAIVSAYVEHNAVALNELPALIASVGRALSELGREPPPAAAKELRPAVPIRRSVKPDAITCLDCGWSGTMLRRHLSSAHGFTAEQYRGRWNLPRDYPLVTRQYSARRSELAKALGLGIRGRRGH